MRLVVQILWLELRQKRAYDSIQFVAIYQCISVRQQSVPRHALQCDCSADQRLLSSCLRVS